MKKIKIIKFLNIAALLLVGYEISQAMLSQSIRYQQYVVEPTQIVETKITGLFTRDNREIEVTNQYKAWLKENIDYVKLINKDNELFTQNINNLPVIVKDGNSFWDKLSILFLHTFSKDNKNYNHNLQTAQGYNNSLDIDLLDPKQSYKLFVGTKLLDKKSHFSKNILAIFDNDRKMAFDYIVLHELSHFISFTVLDEQNQTEIDVRESILTTFFTQQQLDENDYTEKDKENILTQYSESFADSLAMQLMLNKNPQLKNNKKILFNLAKFRLQDNEITHISTVSLLQLEKVLQQKQYKTGSIDDMIALSKECALFSVQYFSDYTEEDNQYTNRQKSVNFKLSGYKESAILNQMDILYAQIQKNQHRNINN